MLNQIFNPQAATRSARHRRLHALYELVCTFVDFMAAVLFVIGSVLFFDDATVRLGTWLFVFGSLCFVLSPTLKLLREVHYWRMGQIDALARRVEDG